jgi:hypothetical protein
MNQIRTELLQAELRFFKGHALQQGVGGWLDNRPCAQGSSLLPTHPDFWLSLACVCAYEQAVNSYLTAEVEQLKVCDITYGIHAPHHPQDAPQHDPH